MYSELDAVTTLNLEGDLVGSARRAMEPMSTGSIACRRMAVMGRILPLSHDLGWHG